MPKIAGRHCRPWHQCAVALPTSPAHVLPAALNPTHPHERTRLFYPALVVESFKTWHSSHYTLHHCALKILSQSHLVEAQICVIMGGFDQPYLYDSDRGDRRFPTKEFDPKAVTRASWEPKPKKEKQDGPLVSFNRHPEYALPSNLQYGVTFANYLSLHEVPTGRTTNFQSMSNATKTWIVWLRRVQLGLRCLELIGALGLLVLMILISNIDALTAWVMRIVVRLVAIPIRGPYQLTLTPLVRCHFHQLHLWYMASCKASW